MSCLHEAQAATRLQRVLLREYQVTFASRIFEMSNSADWGGGSNVENRQQLNKNIHYGHIFGCDCYVFFFVRCLFFNIHFHRFGLWTFGIEWCCLFLKIRCRCLVPNHRSMFMSMSSAAQYLESPYTVAAARPRSRQVLGWCCGLHLLRCSHFEPL